LRSLDADPRPSRGVIPPRDARAACRRCGIQRPPRIDQLLPVGVRAVKPRSGTVVDLAALSKLAPELAETFVTLASDIALVIGPDGVIDRVAMGGSGALAPGAGDWVGRLWSETATGETRVKIEELLREVGATGISRRREINHPTPAGADIPVSYAAVRLGTNGPVLAVGRDMRAIAGIQQQFLEAQQEIEREYWKVRQAESRYRVLFHVATDAVLVVDAENLRIIDANEAASGLFDMPITHLVGMEAVATIDRNSRSAVGELLAAARATGLPGEIRAWLAGRKVSARLSAMPFRSADTMLLLVRGRLAEPSTEGGDARGALVKLIECTPDSIVLADPGGRIRMANPAFIELAGFADERHAHGRQLTDLIGTELAELIEEARHRGIAARRAMTLRGLRGSSTAIEVSAALIDEGDQESIGLTIRARPTAAQPPSRAVHGLAAAIDELTGRIGELDLDALLVEVKQHAERHFLQTALHLSERDRGEAARILGLSERELEERLRGTV